MILLFLWACLVLLSTALLIFFVSAIFVGLYKAIKAEFTDTKEDK